MSSPARRERTPDEKMPLYEVLVWAWFFIALACLAIYEPLAAAFGWPT